MKRRIHFLMMILCGLGLGIGEASAKGKGASKGKGHSSAVSKEKPGKGPSKGKHRSKGTHPSHKVKGSKDKGASKDKGPDSRNRDHWRVDARFRDADRREILSHWGRYQKHPHGLPPGLAKNLRRGKALPPGWEKKLRAGWVVDDDWWPRLNRISGEFLPRGYRMPPETGMFLMGDRLVRVHEPTREVIDLIRIPTVRR